MRLLHTTDFLVNEFRHDKIPRYAILSHTWGEEEVTLQDMNSAGGWDKKGYKKVEAFCSVARKEGYQYVWVDTCCIDKTSSTELSEAINSMYRWYEAADVCYAYLADVPSDPEITDESQGSRWFTRGWTLRELLAPETDIAEKFQRSKWFTRGWTLQELIAPEKVIFLSSTWQPIGDKSSMSQPISRITGIPETFLLGDDLRYASVAQKMSWSAKRKTTRIEDSAYCLMGLFGIYMPMLYGEGDRAFIRLQEEILRVTSDHSLFAWRSTEGDGGILATSPAAFNASGNIIRTVTFSPESIPPTVTSRGIRLSVRFRESEEQGSGLAVLDCTERGDEEKRFAIHLKDLFLTKQEFTRANSSTLRLLDVDPSHYSPTDLYIRQWNPKSKRKGENLMTYAIKFEGIGKDYLALHTLQLPRGWKLDGGLIVTTTVLGTNVLPAHLLVMCSDGNSFQLVLRKYETSITAHIQDGLELNAGTIQTTTASRQAQQHHDEERLIVALSGGGHVDVTIARRILMLQERRHLVGVVEIRYPSTPGAWLQSVALVEEDLEEKALIFSVLRRGYDVISKLILDYVELSIESTDENQLTLLALAAANGSEATVKLLLEKNANVAVKDGNNKTPLHRAAENGYAAVVGLLLEAGADFHVRDQWGGTPLHCAAENGHAAVVGLLLEAGANMNAEAQWNSTPLLLAAEIGHDAVVELLIKKGADVNAKNQWSNTPLHWAAEIGHAALVGLLLGTGADVNARNQWNNTPLHMAVEFGHWTVVDLLGGAHADSTIRNTDGKTPLEWAVKYNRMNIVELLHDIYPSVMVDPAVG